ncbi:hypothetical protein [Streptomyces sp. NPDC014734]|uniref:hypothetical protein n=1 Tax=Streptomyces sp. NPDC014734 TaxID=3364886 RepID=UPI0036F6B8BB
MPPTVRRQQADSPPMGDVGGLSVVRAVDRDQDLPGGRAPVDRRARARVARWGPATAWF